MTLEGNREREMVKVVEGLDHFVEQPYLRTQQYVNPPTTSLGTASVFTEQMLNSKLKAHHPIVFSVKVGGIHWSAEAAILADKVLFSDPTGPAAESSNRDSDLAGH
jgi:hypothetical protein